MNAYPRLSSQAYNDPVTHHNEVVEMILESVTDIWRYYCSERLNDTDILRLRNALVMALPQEPTKAGFPHLDR